MVATLKDTQEAYAELIQFLSDHNLIGYLGELSEDSQARMGLVLNELLDVRRASAYEENRDWASLMLDCIRYFVQEAAAHNSDQKLKHQDYEEKIEALEAAILELQAAERRAS